MVSGTEHEPMQMWDVYFYRQGWLMEDGRRLDENEDLSKLDNPFVYTTVLFKERGKLLKLLRWEARRNIMLDCKQRAYYVWRSGLHIRCVVVTSQKAVVHTRKESRERRGCSEVST